MSSFLDDELGVAKQEKSVKAHSNARPEGSHPVSEAEGEDEEPHDGHSENEDHSTHDVEVNLGGEGVKGHCSGDGRCSDSCFVNGIVVFPDQGDVPSLWVPSDRSGPVNTLLTSKETETQSEDEKNDVVVRNLSADTLAADDSYLTEDGNETSRKANIPAVEINPP